MPAWHCVPHDAHVSDGQEAAELAEYAGLTLLDWQVWSLHHELARRKDGLWAALETYDEIARQNGKGGKVEAQQLYKLFVVGEELQIHTAHEFKTAYEHFRRLVDLADGRDDLRRKVKIIRTGAGDQSIELLNGCRIRFLARSGTSGKGFSADTVYVDEAQHATTASIGAIMPAMSARPNPQIVYTGNAPKADGDVSHELRRRVRSGGEPRLFGAIWGNERPRTAAEAEALRDSVEAWRQANPSLGTLIDEEYVRAERHALAPEEFDRERLGIAEPPRTGDRAPAIPVDEWRACTVGTATARPDAPVSFGFSARLDRSVAFVVAAQQHGDRVFVEVVESRPGCLWLPGRARELVQSWGSRITGLVVDRVDPAAPEIGEIRMGGQKVLTLSADQFAAASVGFAAKVHEGVLLERGDPALFAAVEGLRFKRLGVLQVVDRAACLSDPAVAVAAICAVAGLPAVEPRTATDESWAY